MSLNMETVLLVVVFAAQIAVLSFYSPWQRRRNHEFLVAHYPPAEYPLLYPVPRQEMDRRISLFWPLQLAIGIGSIIALVAGLLRSDDPLHFSQWMYWCLLAQILPMYLSMPWALKVARAMRAMPPPATRSVELRQWRLSDFVSPVWILLGPALQLVALVGAVFVYVVHKVGIPWLILTGAAGVFFLGYMAYLLRVVPLKRIDPRASAADAFRSRQRVFTVWFRGGALLGAVVVLMELNLTGSLHFDRGYLIAAMSILFQMLSLRIVFAQTRDLHLRDFSVYRSEGAAQPSP